MILRLPKQHPWRWGQGGGGVSVCLMHINWLPTVTISRNLPKGQSLKQWRNNTRKTDYHVTNQILTIASKWKHAWGNYKNISMLSLNLSLSLASGSSRKGNVENNMFILFICICLGVFIVCAFSDLLVRRSRDFKGLPTSINCTVFFFLAFSSWLYLKGTQNDY